MKISIEINFYIKNMFFCLIKGRSLAAVFVMALVFSAQNASAMQELSDDVLSNNVGYGLLLSDKIDGAAGTNMTFYRMALNAEVGLNLNIDKLQLGCGGFNNAVVAGACDIDIDYLLMMGRPAGVPAGGTGADSGIIGTPPAGNNERIVNVGAAATSQFKMLRPYLDLAIKNDGSNGREIVGFKIGAERIDGYMGMGHKMTANTNGGGTAGCNTTATDSAGAYFCHDGLNRLSGYAKVQVNGLAYGAPLGISLTVNGTPTLWGTRLNRMIGQVNAVGTGGGVKDLSAALTMLHGMMVAQEDPATRGVYDRDDFFISFQREAVAYPTYGKLDRYSHMANPGWWMNVPYAMAAGVRINLNGGAAPVPDGDMKVLAPDNCLGGLKFC